MKVINVQNLTKKFEVTVKNNFIKDMINPEKRDVTAVDHISFSVDKGESVAFLGPNGAGKTTTTKMMTGLIFPTEGEIDILGYFPFDRKNEYLKKIGLVMGNKAGLNWDLTPSQSFELLKEIYEIPNDEYNSRIEELTTLLDTKNFLDIQVRKLSLGERMKMELIGAILHNPEILFLDEPTIGLDILSKQKIREFLRKIQKESNITIILTSHDMDDIEKVCDRVIVITQGKKIYDDSMDRLISKYQSEKYVQVKFNQKPNSLELNFGKLIEEKEGSITLKVDKSELSKLMSYVVENYDVDDIDIEGVPLETIIKDIFEGK